MKTKNNFLDYSGWINESEKVINEMENAPESLVNRLENLVKEFKTDKEIVSAIKDLGFEEAKTGKERTAEHRFYSPTRKALYIAYDSGYVRFNQGSFSRWMNGTVTVKTPIVNYILPTSRLRLALIFRTALKHGDLYKAWMKYDAKGKTIKDFMHDIRGNIQGRKFGI